MDIGEGDAELSIARRGGGVSHRGRRLRFNAIRSTAGRWLPTTGARGGELSGQQIKWSKLESHSVTVKEGHIFLGVSECPVHGSRTPLGFV
jgi:hypothetical protein